MISLGDLSKYNSSTIYKSVFNGVDVTAENKNALNNISTGINAFTTNPQKSSTLLLMGGKLPANLSGYQWIIALFKAIADAKKGSPPKKRMRVVIQTIPAMPLLSGAIPAHPISLFLKGLNSLS